MKFVLYTTLVVVACIACDAGADHINIGMQHYAQGDFKKARTHLLKAEGKSLGNYQEKEFYTTLGNTFNALNRLDSSIIYHKKAIEIDPQYSEAYTNLGIVYRRKGEYSKSLKCYMEAHKLTPNDAMLNTSLGSLYIYIKNPNMAAKHLRKAIDIDPGMMLAHSNYALALGHLGKYEKSEEELVLAESMGYKNGHSIRNKIKELQIQKDN